MPAPTLATWLAFLDAALFAVLGAVHVYWAAGGQWGAAAAFPDEWRKPLTGPSVGRGLGLHRPTPLGTLAVALALFAAAGVMLGRVGALPGVPWLPPWVFPQVVFTLGTWVLAALFLARAIGDFRTIGLFKQRRGTVFATWDTRLFSPLCLGIAALAGAVALLAP
jgi:hypothetical protein